jgi:hypothetical protein
MTALQQVMDVVSAEREVELIKDESGRSIGGRSKPVLKTRH